MTSGQSNVDEADAASQLANDFAGAASELFVASSLAETLSRVIEMSVEVIEACDAAGIYLQTDTIVTRPLHTDLLVAKIEALQKRSGAGPGIEARTLQQPSGSRDLAHDERWGTFGPSAAAEGIRSMLSVPLFSSESQGVLNLYSRFPDAFSVIDRAKGLLLGSLAGVACSVAQAHADDQRQVDRLQIAMANRELIGQAQGILMERERVSAEDAFDILRKASQHLNLKVRVVAKALVSTRESPDVGGSSLG